MASRTGVKGRSLRHTVVAIGGRRLGGRGADFLLRSATKQRPTTAPEATGAGRAAQLLGGLSWRWAGNQVGTGTLHSHGAESGPCGLGMQHQIVARSSHLPAIVVLHDYNGRGSWQTIRHIDTDMRQQGLTLALSALAATATATAP